MDALFLLSERQMARIAPHFPLVHGVPRVDDRRVVSGIVHVIKHGLQWKDAPKGYGPHKKLYNRFIRRSRMGVRWSPFRGQVDGFAKLGSGLRHTASSMPWRVMWTSAGVVRPRPCEAASCCNRRSTGRCRPAPPIRYRRR